MDHPNIVRVYEYFEDRSHYFIVLEYILGGDLMDLLEEMKRFTEKLAAEVIR